MTNKREASERFSLARWSQRKLESAKTRAESTDVSAAAPSSGTAPLAATPAAAFVTETTAAAPPQAELPPVESLTFDSDFTAFLRPEVDPDLRRAALKRLFRDPRFNVMDGLDTYIDDYTKSDTIPPDMLAELVKRFDFAEAPPPAAAPDQDAAESGAAASSSGHAETRPPDIGAGPAAATTGESLGDTAQFAPAQIARPSAVACDTASTHEQPPPSGTGPAPPTSPEQSSNR